MHEEFDNTPIQGDVARMASQLFPDSLALCEPWFGSASIVFSPGKLHFKVHVVNDPGQGLVKLFEMARIEKSTLRDIILHDDVHTYFPRFSGKSTFLKTDGDAVDGILAFRACIQNLGIDVELAVATETAFNEAITTIHAKLEPVLVESLPITEFITRFDKSYTVFFTPSIHKDVEGALAAFGPALVGLQGILLIEVRGAVEQRTSLRFHSSGDSIRASGTIVAHGLDGRSRYFVMFKRVA